MWNSRRRAVLLVSWWFGASCLAGAADLRLADVFGEHMVLQRGRPLFIRGQSEPGDRITVKLGSVNGFTTAAADGRWSVRLPPMKAGGPYRLTVRGGKDRLVLDDVVVGDVWVCAGGSGMAIPLAEMKGGAVAIRDAATPEIRLIQIGGGGPFPAQENAASWEVLGPETAARSSAVASTFGRELHRRLLVPVGLIVLVWPSSRIEPWISPRGLASVPELHDLSESLEVAVRRYEEKLAPALPAFDDWLVLARRAIERGIPVPAMPPLPRHPLDDPASPTALFCDRVAPWTRVAVRGVIWHQGEANLGDGEAYFFKMRALIEGWRAAWRSDDLPFYFVQLRPYHFGRRRSTEKRAEGHDPLALPELWEAQRRVLELRDTAMVVTTDLDDPEQVDELDMGAVGLRLARCALNRTYRAGGPDGQGPVPVEAHCVDGGARVRFDSVHGGLRSRDGEALTWFEVAGADQVWHRAEGSIDGDAVLVRSDRVAKPAFVRFAWHQEAQPNLVDGEGLPASPFRMVVGPSSAGEGSR